MVLKPTLLQFVLWPISAVIRRKENSEICRGKKICIHHETEGVYDQIVLE